MASLVARTSQLPGLSANKFNLCRIANGVHKRINLTKRWHGGPKVESSAPTVQITFINPHPATARLQGTQKNDGDDKLTVEAKVGETLLQTAQRHDIDLEGACEGGKRIIMIMIFFFSSKT
jgi:hypothetical protein